MQYRTFIWAASLTLLVVINLLQLSSSDLNTNQDFLIGEATANGVSIGQRLLHVYQLIGIGSLLFLIAYFGLKKKLDSSENPLLKHVDVLLTIAGVIFALSIFHPPLKETGYIVFSLAALALISGIKNVFKQNYLQKEFWLIAGLILIVNYLLFHSAVAGGISILIFWFIQRFKEFESKISFLVASAFLGLPIVCFIGIETPLALNQRGIYFQSYWPFFLIGSLLLLGFSYFFIAKKKTEKLQLFFNYLLPLALISIGITQCYSPQIIQGNEMFEAANQLNPVMQAKLFGEIPLVDNLSSHLLSDFFWVYVYTVFNGYHSDASMLTYVDLNYIVALLSVYFFVKRISNYNTILIALFVILPTAYFVLPFYYSYTLIPIAFFYSFAQHNDKKQLLYFFLSLLVLVFWRLDIAVSLVSASVLFIPLWYYFQKETRKSLLKYALVFGGIGALLLTWFLISSPIEFLQAKTYFGANQAHGLSRVTYQETNVYFLSYYLLPVVIIIIGLYHIIGLLNKTVSPISAVVILLCLFYVFNLQRGIVRHSFMENNDTQINSFAWLILLIQAIQFIKPADSFKRWSTIGITTCLLPLFLSVQQDNGRINILQRSNRLSLKDLPRLENKRINRVVSNPEFDSKHLPLIQFLTSNLKDQQTFLDFSNNSCLYFYTGKNVPSYFNQYLQNTINGELQGINLKELKRSDIPYVVFSQIPEGFLDNTDNIPNKVRYYRITNHIYRNYEPLAKIGDYRVWKTKGKQDGDTTLGNYPTHDEHWNLGLIPYYWKATKNEDFQPTRNVATLEMNENRISFKRPLLGNEFVEVKLYSPKDQSIVLSANNFSLSIKAKAGLHSYKLPLGCSENLYLQHQKSINFASETAINIKNVKTIKLTITNEH